MVATAVDLDGLLAEVDGATALLRSSPGVPLEVADLVDSLHTRLHADAPLRLGGDPYLTTMLFAGALRAERALRRDRPEAQRDELRVALEQFRQSLRDLLANKPVGAERPVRQVLAWLVEVMAAPQKDLAELLGVSTRQLQRWLSSDGPTPSGGDEARIRVAAQVVNQLRHVFTGPGVMAWFGRPHPTLGVAPLDLLGDPLQYPSLLAAATGARAMTG